MLEHRNMEQEVLKKFHANFHGQGLGFKRPRAVQSSPTAAQTKGQKLRRPCSFAKPLNFFAFVHALEKCIFKA